MNLRDIEVFRAVMMTGGASRAADLLNTSQPTVSRSIAHLERTLGFTLFDRVRGKLVPTRDGQIFMHEVTQNLIGLDRLRHAAARIREIGEGTIRIASLAALGNTVVPRAIARFLAASPNVSVALQIRTSNVVRDLVATGQADLGLAADEIDTSGLEARSFASPRAVCVLPRAHRLATAKSITARTLGGERFIALSPDDTVRRVFDKLAAEAGVRVKAVVETPFSATVATLAGEGVGVGLANPLAIEPAMQRRIAVVRFEPAIHFRAMLIFSPAGRRSRMTDAFLRCLEAALAERR